MADYDIDNYKKWDKMDCTVPEEEKLELDYQIDSDGEPPEDEVGDIRNVIRNKNEKIVRKEILKVGEGLDKPGKPYIVKCHAMGYTKDKFLFLPLVKNVYLTLGDLRLPTGLWKSMEHMKKGECAKIWIKPGEYGFAREKHSDAFQWPEAVKDDEELKHKLKTEEIYYEIEIVEWTVRADILGDGNLMKTYEFVASGYDRCGDDDDIIVDYEISRITPEAQQHTIEKESNQRIDMLGHHTWNELGNKFTLSMAKVLKSMKLGEISYTIISYSWLKQKDSVAIEKYGLEEGDKLRIWISFKEMLKVDDFYKDGTTYKKIIRKGDGTASPFSDSTVSLQLKVAYKKLKEDEEERVFVVTKEPITYTIDEYTLPPLIRNILKTLKLREVAEVHTVLKDECIPEFEDEAHGNFKKEWFDQVGEVDQETGKINWIIFTLEMTDFDTPESMHGLHMKDKIPRLLRMKNLATKFFKAQNWGKACKEYQRMYSHFSLKDIFNNLKKEDETTEEYKNVEAELKKIQIQSLTNILVVKTKMENWNDIIEMSDKALEIEPENIKALFFRGKAFLNLSDYDAAIDIFNKILTIEGENKDVSKELAKAKKAKKQYEEKCKQMFKFK